MKKINLNQLSMSWNERKKPQRFARYAAMLIMLLTLGVGQMWGGNAGYVGNNESYFKNYVEYSKNGGSATQFKVDGSGQSDLALGVVSSLTLTQYGVGMYQDEDNLNGKESDKFCYWIHQKDDSSEDWTEVTGNWQDFDMYGWYGGWRHPGFGHNNLGINVLDGLGAGEYKLTFYFKHQGNGNWGNAWLYLSNGGSNYNITFTINPVVTFKANGGMGSDYTQRVTYNTNTALNANTFTRTGYTFAGWATSADGSVVYSDMANVKLTAHTTLYAKWTAKTYNITYKDQGNVAYSGSNGSSLPSSYTYGVGASLVPGEKAGYSFGGWYTASDCSSGYTTSISTSATGDKTFYAKWTLEPGVSLSATSATLNIGQTVRLTATGSNASNITKYDFYEGSTQIGTVTTSATSATYDYTPTTTGNKTMKVIMTYNSGSSTVTSSTVGLTLNTPSVATLTEASSTEEMWIGIDASDALTFSATSNNVSSGASVTWSISDATGGTFTQTGAGSYSGKSWTYTPASTGAKTITVTMNVGGNNYTKTYSLEVYERWNIYVHDIQGWGEMSIYSYTAEAHGNWPGTVCSKYNGSNSWYEVTLDSKSTRFILNKNGDKSGSEDIKTSDLTTGTSSGTYAAGTYWYITSNTGGTLVSVSVTDPTVTLTASVANCKDITLNGNVTNFGGDGTKASDMKEVYFQVGGIQQSAGTISNSNGTFSKTISSATAGATNTLQAFATNIHGTGSSSTLHYTNVTLNLQGGADGTISVTAVENTAMPAGATAPSKIGYTFGGYYASAGGSGTQYYSATMTSANTWDQTTTDATIHANWTANTYSIHFNGNGSTSGSMDNQTGVAYDSETPLTLNAFTRTGYTFAGWAISADDDVVRADGAAHDNLSSTQGATVELYAKWTPKKSAITFDYQTSATGYGSSGSISNTTGLEGTYDAAMTTLTGTMPSGKNGYAFMGFFDATGGGGTQYYNADGTSANDWDKDTESGTTLYAYYKKSEITGLTLDAATVAPGGEVGVTPTISPTPAGTTIICWEVRYADNNNLVDPQPETTSSTGKWTFNAPASNGKYKIVATLKTGSDCSAVEAEVLSTNYTSVTVAGSNTVTVEYKQSSTTIKSSTSVPGNPTNWSDAITAPDIFGYTFSSWTAGDGISLSVDGSSELGEDESDEETIYIKATYDGTLTANYTPKSLIYFKNTLGWSSVYVNFYGENGYWDDKGSGNESVTNRNKPMSRIGETDVWYYDYGAVSIIPTKWVSFTEDEQEDVSNGYKNFWRSGTGEPVCYPARRADDLADKATETGFYASTPMFVPLASQSPITKNEGGGGKALYYNSGYWTKYLPGTGYTLEFYDNGTGAFIKSQDFSSADELMPMKVTVDLEATTTYKFQIKRHGDVYLGNSGTMTYTNHGQDVAWEMTNTGFSMCRITTTASGDYTFNFTYSAYHNESTGKDEYRLRLSVDYPVSTGDYRLIYTDNTRNSGTRFKPSAIIPKENNGSAIASFFVRYNNSPVLRIQQASVANDGTITWNEYPTSGTPTNQITGAIASAITKDSVWNFNLTMNGSGALSVTSVEGYSGNYYIRTDAANSKWDNFRTDPDHLMTYSDYLKSDVGYSHYYTHWVNKDDLGRKNVKFVIANDYSPCISDTLARETASGAWEHIGDWMEEGGDLKRSANVRFMWDIATNAVSRAYVDGAQEDGSEFLLMLNADSPNKIRWSAESALTDDKVTFSDNGNWIYEANIQAQPGAQIKLKSTWGDTGNAIEQYFKGTSESTETLVGGSTSDWYDFRLIYDFKTNRLVTSYVPVSDNNITKNIQINADVMFIREHQGDIAQLTFDGSGAISKIQTAYAVMRFNRWTLNNKDKSSHTALPVGNQKSTFERGLYWISFPFKVNLNEAFGFGTYGTHWIMMRYNGARRATEGYWADSEGFWEYITNRNTILQPNEGYVLALDLDLLGESSSVFTNTDVIELYFPSYGDMPDISSSEVTTSLEAHQCTIDRTNGGAYNVNKNRTIADSHWNVMGVPTYVNTSAVTYSNTTWTNANTNFFYEWNMSDNTYTPQSGSEYTFHAMHSYMVQYSGNVTWEAKSGSPYPSSIAARKAETQDVEYRLELQSDTRMEDQTFVRFTDNAEATVGFEFGQDLSKEYNGNRSNIYTLTAGTPVAGNSQPHPLTTTIVPVGVKIAANGEYTFSMPEGTNGGDVWLIDNANSSRTNLGLMDYTVNLTAGTYEGRFSLEFPVQNVVTDIENAANANANANADAVRKVFVGGQLYIIRDGVIYNASGARVQ